MSDHDTGQSPEQWPSWLTRGAFVLALSLMLARGTMIETLRDPLPVVPGSDAVPRGTGAAAGLVLDLICCAPALLVLARRAVDPVFRLRLPWSPALLAAMSIWAAASTAWASDRFAALVSASHLIAAAAMLWATVQLVRSWARLRVVAGVCFGMLLVYVAQGALYRFVDVPDNVRYWQEHKAEELARRGWEPGSFEAIQFEKKLTGGEMVGFSASPNTYAAMLVFLGVIGAGVAVQRFANRDEPGWASVIIVGLAAGAWIMTFAQSRAAYATPFVAAGILLTIRLFGRMLARRRGAIYAGIVILAIAGAAAAIGHGLRHGTLFHDSLTFRWRYWVGAARIVAQHPVTGVGWANFGEYYLGVRLPVASEEVKDPHNFVVRASAELGVIGAALMIAWVLRLWWEMSAPRIEVAPRARGAPGGGGTGAARSARLLSGWTIGAVAAGGILINILASIDFAVATSEREWFVMLELFKRLLYLGLIVLGMAVVVLESSKRPEVDDRPSPWLLWAAIAALAVFFIHNLIDFSMFEVGPMLALATVCGMVLALRTPNPPGEGARAGALITLAAGVVAWVAAAGVIVAPVVAAESAAQQADDELRGGHAAAAARDYSRAFGTLWIRNGDYASRAARAMMLAGETPDNIRAMLDAAVAADPMSVGHRLSRARFELQQPVPDYRRAIEDFEWAIPHNPADVETRVEYAGVLEQMGQKIRARDEYREALRYNSMLEPDEPKRLPADRVARIRSRIEALGA